MGNSSYFNFLEWLFVNCKEERRGATNINRLIMNPVLTSEGDQLWRSTHLPGGPRPSPGSTPSPAEGPTIQHNDDDLATTHINNTNVDTGRNTQILHVSKSINSTVEEKLLQVKVVFLKKKKKYKSISIKIYFK